MLSLRMRINVTIMARDSVFPYRTDDMADSSELLAPSPKTMLRPRDPIKNALPKDNRRLKAIRINPNTRAVRISGDTWSSMKTAFCYGSNSRLSSNKAPAVKQQIPPENTLQKPKGRLPEIAAHERR